MVWGRDSAPWSWYFKESNPRYPHSYQVWRPEFDHLLLENSRANSVDVRYGHQVLEVIFHGDRAAGVRYSTDGGEERIAGAGFVVDASGQRALLARKLRLRRWDPFFRNVGVYGYFSGGRRLPPPDETNIFIESYENGWLWNIPLHTGWAGVGAVVDGSESREAIRKAGPHRFLMDQIAQSCHSAEMLGTARLESGPFTVKDWSYTSRRTAGDGYVLVGDAACFVDPLFSSGVHLALMSGVLAAAYVTTALNHPDMREAAAAVYQALYGREYGHFREMAMLFYSSNRTAESYFWEARRLLGDEGAFSPRHAFIRAVAGQPPTGCERAVLDRGLAPTEFIEGVRAVESDRAGRRRQLAELRTDADVRQTRLYHAVPGLAKGVRVERKPVVAEGEFVWGHVISGSGHDGGTPCSGLVARIVSFIDGRATVAEIADRLRGQVDQAGEDRILATTVAALEILYVDGTVEEFLVAG